MSTCNRCGRDVVWMAVDGLRGGIRRTVPVDAGTGSDEILRPRADLPQANLRLTGKSVPGRYGPVDLAKYVEPGEGRYRLHSCPRRTPR